MKNATLSYEDRLADTLNRYASYRLVINQGGLRFTSESVGRAKIERVLVNQPAGLVAIEGLIANSFIPEDWEIINL